MISDRNIMRRVFGHLGKLIANTDDMLQIDKFKKFKYEVMREEAGLPKWVL